MEKFSGSCVVAATTAAAAAITTATATTAAATATAAVSTTTAAAATVATAAATAAASTATKAAATCAGRTCFHWTCFVNHETAATELLTVHAADSGLCFCIAAHFHKAEALGTASVTFHHDFGAGNRTVGRKRLLQVFITERIGQVAHVKFVAHVRTPQNNSQNAMVSKPAINKPMKT